MKRLLSITACLAIVAATIPATASTSATGTLESLAASSQGGSSSAGLLFARQGADDPAGHDRHGGAAGTKGKGRGGHDDGAHHA